METANEQVHGSEFTVAPIVPTPAEAPVLAPPAASAEVSANPVEAAKLADAPQLVTPAEIVAPTVTEPAHVESTIAEPALAATPAEATVTIAAPAIALDPIPTVTVPFTPSATAKDEPFIAADAPKAASGSAPHIAPPVKYVPPKAVRSDSARSASAGRFGLLAAVIAVAAGIGAAGGAAGYAGITTAMAPTPAPAPMKAAAVPQRSDNADEIKALKDSLAQVRGNLKTLSDGVAALRTSSDTGGKAAQAQLAKLGEAIERLERAQVEPNARLAKLTEAVDRMERRPTATAAAPHPVSGHETTGSVRPPPPLPPLGGAPGMAKPVLDGWNLLRVQGGVALVDSRYGPIEVEVGDDIRGAGRVQEIKRQDGRWMVVTNRGLIVAGR